MLADIMSFLGQFMEAKTHFTSLLIFYFSLLFVCILFLRAFWLYDPFILNDYIEWLRFICFAPSGDHDSMQLCAFAHTAETPQFSLEQDIQWNMDRECAASVNVSMSLPYLIDSPKYFSCDCALKESPGNPHQPNYCHWDLVAYCLSWRQR